MSRAIAVVRMGGLVVMSDRVEEAVRIEGLVSKTGHAEVSLNSFAGDDGDVDASTVDLTTRYASQSFQRQLPLVSCSFCGLLW